MGSIIVSMYIKKGILSILILKDGRIEIKEVEKIKDDTILGSMYLSLIYGFCKALRMTRNYLENNADCSRVVFEVNNSTFVKWINNGYSKEDYQNDFSVLLNTLEEIPMQYNIIVQSNPKAMVYADERYLSNKLKIGGLF